MSESVVKLMSDKWQNNSDAVLAHPRVRALLHEDVGHAAGLFLELAKRL